jgi:hypothetical protein
MMSNPALKAFEPLVGDWRTTGSHPFMSGIELHGSVTFDWLDDGAFLRMRTHVDHPKIPDGLAVFGSDDQAGSFYMLYFDERGVSRKYDVSITDNQLVWWRDNPEFSQRFTLDIATDKLTGRGEMSREGGDWEADISLTYTRK